MKRLARVHLNENTATSTYAAAIRAESVTRCGELTSTATGSAASIEYRASTTGRRSIGRPAMSAMRFTSTIVRIASRYSDSTNASTAAVVSSVTCRSTTARTTNAANEITMFSALIGRT